MSDLIHNLTEKLGIDASTVTDQAQSLLDQHRDKIPDALEGSIESAIHGSAVGGFLEKLGVGGHHEEEAKEDEATEEESTDVEESSDDEEASDEPSDEETEESDESEEEEESDEEDSQ